ncbi:hypothetical protein TSAR_016901 [Trichomalopsis sarcophagae]|uniref:Uncharacterized protein n=1 Tax=Trichomalopsis sarcophagae TaxID=543379 RepID=A0A232EHV5_9HYME|nr:hypothetical protein TSAR_016901 [Trichomalopsis sarcophagae]
MRSSSDYDKFKDVEHRFFVLYSGSIVLKKILPANVYNHFLLFHVGCGLLTSKEAVSYVNLSRNYLIKFVEDAVSLHGVKFVLLNIHNLCHVVGDVENMQCNLNDISAFPYESELGQIKNMLLSPHRTIVQYCRRIHEDRSILNQVVELPQELLFSSKHPDNLVKLKSGDIVQIVKILDNEKKIYLKVVKYKIKKSLYTYPCDSAMLDIYEIENVNNSRSTSRTVPLESLSPVAGNETWLEMYPYHIVEFDTPVAGNETWLEMYPYHIVEFVTRGRKSSVRKVDIVATKWISFDNVKKKCFAKYPLPPYTKEKYNVLNKALEELSDAPVDWEQFTVKIRGKAGNINEAFKKMKALDYQETALTMESAESSSDAEKKAADKLRQQQFMNAAARYSQSIHKQTNSSQETCNQTNSLKTISQKIIVKTCCHTPV